MKLPGREVEHYPVAVTVEAVALGWLRQRQAPHGAVVVADHEVSPRTRRGDVWGAAGALRAAVVLRPDLAADAADLLWAHALLAGAEAENGHPTPWWPERLVEHDAEMGVVRVASQLAPGRVDSAVMTFRLHVAPGRDRADLLAATLAHLDELLAMPPVDVAARYRAADPLAGTPVRVDLLPRGAVRGAYDGIDAQGALTIESAGGNRRRLAVDQIAAVVRLDDNGR